MNPNPMQWIALALFIAAIVHTFLVKKFQNIAHKYPEGSVAENFFHLLGEIEVVFGVWAGLLLAVLFVSSGPSATMAYLDSFNFVEPLFVFVILVVCSTQPILVTAENMIASISKLIPLPRPLSFLATTLFIGPILGSFITEPAAMTVTALILLQHYFSKGISEKLKYALLGALFVNISIGGTLTPYAAPPIIMVAGKWDWDLKHMLVHFGWRGALACLFITVLLLFRFKKEIRTISIQGLQKKNKIPFWIQSLHLLILFGIVASAHYPKLFIGAFLLFLGLVKVTKEYQKPLQLQQGLLVSFFLAGLVLLGGMQGWWLKPILENLDSIPLFFGAVGLTAVTDNAALTYLGTLVPTLSEASKYALVSGAVVGGGLTVIANAPNPAGYGILNESFGKSGISPLDLFKAAFIPTVIAAVCFMI